MTEPTAKTVYYTATTLDGYIADPADSLDWLFEVPHAEDDGGWDAFIGRIGPLVTGTTTYRWMLDRHFTEHPGHWQEFYGDRAEPTVWRMEAVRSDAAATVVGTGLLVLSGTGEQLYVQPRPPKAKRLREVRLTKAQPKLVLADATGSGTVWEISRDSGYVHPTQKPVALATRAIENSSRPGEIVLDGFSGSGTTLIACELTGRRARAVELDPRYVEATIARWEKFTGEHARKLGEPIKAKKKASRRAARGRTEVLPAAPAE